MSIEAEITRIHSTNRLIPQGALRCRCVRRLFSGWIRHYEGAGRLFTPKIAEQICDSLRSYFGLQVLDDEFRKEECRRMHSRLKMARKRKLKSRKQSAMPLSMDEMNTLPISEDCTLGHMYHIKRHRLPKTILFKSRTWSRNHREVQRPIEILPFRSVLEVEGLEASEVVLPVREARERASTLTPFHNERQEQPDSELADEARFMLVWLHSWLISRPKRRPSACVPVSWIAFDLSPIHALSKTETECRPGLDLEVEFTNEEIEWAISALQQQPCSSKRPGRIDLRSSFFFLFG